MSDISTRDVPHEEASFEIFVINPKSSPYRSLINIVNMFYVTFLGIQISITRRSSFVRYFFQHSSVMSGLSKNSVIVEYTWLVLWNMAGL